MAIIKPYYQDDRLKTIDSISYTVEDLILKNKVTQKDIDDSGKLVIGNNVCVIAYNEAGKEIYSSDSLGQLCMFDKDIEIDNEHFVIEKDPQKMIEILKDRSPLSMEIPSTIIDKEMALYGRQIKANLANYYLLINTPLEPIESYVSFILNQYLYVAIIAVIIALVLAFFLSRRISKPIVDMKQEANKLAQGNYDASFKTNSYSEINELASTLDDATDKLSKINDLRKDLLANVSHDIKTPLTMIKAYAEMIKDISGDDPVKRNEHLDVIIKETDYLNKLVTDMSELSKLQSGSIVLTKANFDLKQCVLDVVELLSKLIEEKNITLNSDLVDVVIYADEIKMSQVVYNFISNAIKHSDDNGLIEIKMLDDENKIRLEVRDYGEGIKEDALPYIWDRYYKVDKNFNRNVNSTGLGLAIAKAILEAHNARYGVESKYGEGSMFFFELDKDYDEQLEDK
ncbi:MAG: HAMP domain-containing sensor histidine kinase [Erysipelotrichaceae bacterium]|nr:HAMP domain-containing sensor histidine kinase [Erysipelotrichaceae bacterium]